MHKFCFLRQVLQLYFLSLFAKLRVRFRSFGMIFRVDATVICPYEPVFSVDSHGHTTVTPSSISCIPLMHLCNDLRLHAAAVQARNFSRLALQNTPLHQILFTDKNYFNAGSRHAVKAVGRGKYAHRINSAFGSLSQYS